MANQGGMGVVVAILGVNLVVGRTRLTSECLAEQRRYTEVERSKTRKDEIYIKKKQDEEKHDA